MKFPLGASLPAKPFLFASNWDRFGGRASEILNAYYVSRRLDIDFRFTWPKEPRFPELDEMIMAFAPEFVEKFFIQESAVENLQTKQVTLDGKVSLANFVKNFEGPGTDVIGIRLGNFFSVPFFKDDAPEFSVRQFSLSVPDIWSQDVLQIHSVIEKLYRDTYSIHARYGDLVTGSWKNFVEPTKYITGQQIESVIEICLEQDKKLEVISDSFEIIELFSPHKTKEDFLLSKLPQFEIQNRQTLIDLFKMQFSAGVFAPVSSAYSKLGSHLGGKEIISISRRRISSQKEFAEFAKTQPFWKILHVSTRGSFVSRDLDQEINALLGIFNLATFERVTQSAYEADVKNPVSCNHLAIAKTLLRQDVQAKLLLKSSKEISMHALDIHEDPKYFSLLSEFACVLIYILRARTIHFRKKSPIVASIRDLRETKAALVRTKPFQIEAHFAYSVTAGLIDLLEKISSRRFAPMRFFLLSLGFRGFIKEPFAYSQNNLFLLNLLQSIYSWMQNSRVAR